MKNNFAFFVYFFIFSAISALVVFAATGPFRGTVMASSSPRPSKDATLMLAYPLTIRSIDSEKSKIDIFATADSGLPSKGKSVTVTSSIGSVEPQNMVTDDVGQATFYLTSDLPGEAILSLKIDGEAYPQTLTINIE